MKIVSAKCPNCGANIEVDENSNQTKCEFCNSNIIVEEAIQKYKLEIKGEIKIKGIKTDEDKLKDMEQFIRTEEYDSAKRLIDEILKENPFNEKALINYLTINNLLINREINRLNNCSYTELLSFHLNYYGISSTLENRIKKMEKSSSLDTEYKKYLSNYEKLLNMYNEKKYSEIVIRRVPGAVGWALKMICYINGKEIGRIHENQEISYQTNEKEVEFKCRLTMGNPMSEKHIIKMDCDQIYVDVKQGRWNPKVIIRK